MNSHEIVDSRPLLGSQGVFNCALQPWLDLVPCLPIFELQSQSWGGKEAFLEVEDFGGIAGLGR